MTKHIPFVLLVLLGASLPAQAQAQGILRLFKGRQPEPATTAPELINQLQGADQARTRSDAADHLRQFDAKQFPEAVRALIHTLDNDVNPSVRAEAAQSLARMRPVTQAAGQALERASSRDSVWRVRMQAWSALKQIQMAGYRNRGPGAIEDYIANAPPPAPPAQKRPVDPNSLFVDPPPTVPTSTPILADPVPLVAPPGNSLMLTEPEPAHYTVPRPLPVGTPWSTAVPTPPRRITPPEVINETPNLTPPPPTPPFQP